MRISARRADASDVGILTHLYELLVVEMSTLSPLWPQVSGLAGDPTHALHDLMASRDAEVGVGLIDDVVFGFVLAVSTPVVTGESRIATIRYLFTEPAAREVGVAAAMLDHVIAVMGDRGHELFDADVLPGHRLAKNFFEAAGFKARHITMHRK